ncbi:MAG TPA: DUF4142 domain-containing protein [Methylocystis sp.]|jgi:putative membrane protein
MKSTIATCVLLALAMPGAAVAQSSQMQREAPAPGSRATQPQRETAQGFVNQAWNINNFEIQAGQEAVNKEREGDYKDYAQMIAKDHMKMQDELRSITGSARGVELPNAADAEHAQKLKQLGSATGAAFEREFRTQQIKGHQQAIRLFRDYAASGDNPELQKFAQNSIPILERHLQQAEALKTPGGVM